MESKPYVVTEHFFPKEEHFKEVLKMLVESSEMMKEQDGLLMHLILKPEQKNGAITGMGEKMKSLTTDLKANLYTVEHGWHAESHD